MTYFRNLMTPRFLVALVVLALFAGSIVVMSFFEVPAANQEVVIQLVGGVNALAGSDVAFVSAPDGIFTGGAGTGVHVQSNAVLSEYAGLYLAIIKTGPNVASEQRILSTEDFGAGNRAYLLAMANGKIRWVYRNTSDTAFTAQGAITIAGDSFYMLSALVRADKTTALFVNGVADGTATITGTPRLPTTQKIVLGGIYNTNAGGVYQNNFLGNIYYAELMKGDLSPQDVIDAHAEARQFAAGKGITIP